MPVPLPFRSGPRRWIMLPPPELSLLAAVFLLVSDASGALLIQAQTCSTLRPLLSNLYVLLAWEQRLFSQCRCRCELPYGSSRCLRCACLKESFSTRLTRTRRVQEPRKSDAPQLRDEYRTYKILAGSRTLFWLSLCFADAECTLILSTGVSVQRECRKSTTLVRRGCTIFS